MIRLVQGAPGVVRGQPFPRHAHPAHTPQLLDYEERTTASPASLASTARHQVPRRGAGRAQLASCAVTRLRPQHLSSSACGTGSWRVCQTGSALKDTTALRGHGSQFNVPKARIWGTLEPHSAQRVTLGTTAPFLGCARRRDCARPATTAVLGPRSVDRPMEPVEPNAQSGFTVLLAQPPRRPARTAPRPSNRARATATCAWQAPPVELAF